MKKILSIAICTSIIANNFVYATNSNELFSTSVQYTLSTNVEHTNTRENKALTRAEAIKLLIDSAKIKTNGKKAIFLDVPENHWANEYIKIAFEKGLIKGYDQKTFKPDEPITHIQWISMLVNAHKNFDKKQNIIWPKTYLEFAQKNKIINQIPSDKEELKKLLPLNVAEETIKQFTKESSTPQNTSTTVKYGGYSFVATPVEKPQEKIVNFKDQGLKKFILDNLHSYNGEDKTAGIDGEYDFKLLDTNYRKPKSETEIFIKDMEQIEAIGIRGYYDFEAYSNAESEEEIEKLKLEVTDLTGLEYAKNLKMLSISSHDVEASFSPNALKDISILQELKNLELLRLSHNAITDITPISKLTNLKKLYISHNLIENISSLANMNNLTALDVSRNNIKDINAISNLTNLTELTIVDTKIDNIDATQNMLQLQRIDLRENNVSDISILSNVASLKEVFFDKNKIKDFTPLTNLNNIKYVSSGHQTIELNDEIAVNSRTFEIDSVFRGFSNVVQEAITIESDVQGVNVTLNKDTNKLAIELTDEFVTQNNNSIITLNLTFKATNKYEFYWSYEDFEYHLNNVKLNINITN